MASSRIITLRKAEKINKSDIYFPLFFIGENYGYSVSSILRKINNSSGIHIGTYPDIFPYTITEYFWIKAGEAGKEPWIALGKLKGDIYFLYTASMILPSKTFINNGYMNLWISLNYSDLIEYVMDTSLYNEYILNTV
jgi:hypothetical protein